MSAKQVAAVLAAAAISVPLIAQWEGVEYVGYRDIVGVPTVCYGSTRNVIVGKRVAERECLERLASDTVDHAVRIDACIKVPLAAETRAAFTSFAFNVGTQAFCSSTLVSKANARDYAGACAELDRWVMAGGQRVQGLVNRRAAEREWCERGISMNGPSSTP
jgi:lysozyme